MWSDKSMETIVRNEEEICAKLAKEISQIWKIPRCKITGILNKHISDDAEYLEVMKIEKRILRQLAKLYYRWQSKYVQYKERGYEEEIPLTRLCEISNIALEILLESKN